LAQYVPGYSEHGKLLIKSFNHYWKPDIEL